MEAIILGLDVAGRTGWAWGDGSKRPTVGHWELPDYGEDLAPYFVTFRNHLVGMLHQLLALVDGDAGRVTVLFEAPVFPKPFIKGGRIIQHASIKDRRKLYGLVGIVELTCGEFGIQCFETSVAEVKKQLTGQGDADKDAMVRAAEGMGLRIAVHDEADAVGVFLVGVRHYAKHHLPAMDKLLHGAKGLL